MGMVFGPPRSVAPPGLALDGLRSQRCRAGLSWFVPSGLDFWVCPLGLDFDGRWLSCSARPMDGMHTISSTEHRAFISGTADLGQAMPRSPGVPRAVALG